MVITPFIHLWLVTQDFIAIGVDKEGFRLRLERAAKKLRPLQFEFRPPVSVIHN